MIETSQDSLYEHPTLAAVYDATSGWAKDSDFYLSLASASNLDILDLGCGTGLLCCAYAARGHSVVGVDPAEAMLEQAKKKPNGHLVTWVKSNGQSFVCNRKYDLILMTGHAFQCLLNDQDVSQLLNNIRTLLKPDGTFVFESRNPHMDWKREWQGLSSVIEYQASRFTMSTNVLQLDGDLMTFEHSYEFGTESLRSVSTIRFPSMHTVEGLISKADLVLIDVFGDWDCTTFNPNSSREMIFSVSRN